MRIAIPQLNYYTGDIEKNTALMVDAIKKAQKEKADLIIFPELALCGSFPMDLLEKEYFIDACRLAVDNLAAICGNLAAIIGAPNLDSRNGIMYNSAYFIQNGEVIDGVHKTVLSDYDIFEESRYFVTGEENQAIRFKNKNIRILFDEYESEYIEKNDDLVIFLGNSPFTWSGFHTKQAIFSSIARQYSKNIICVSRAGASTSLVFEGGSAAFNYKGSQVVRLKEFDSDLQIVESEQMGKLPALQIEERSKNDLIHIALVSGLKDYFYKNNFKKAVIGLSGGIDSAVVAALAVEALGSTNVLGILMPSEFSTEHSLQDAKDLAANLGITHHTLPIKSLYSQYLDTLSPLFKDLPFNVTEENLQARIRGALLFAISNKFGNIVLNTSNKSEGAVGYGTLYGDLCGSLSVIGDVYKTEVYELARYINRDRIIIPEHTITKAPSAELRPNQKDQDSLPEYNELDAILKMYLEDNLSHKDIVAKGYDNTLVAKILPLVDRNEYKRAQCPPNIKVSKKAFGTGRKMPF